MALSPLSPGTPMGSGTAPTDPPVLAPIGPNTLMSIAAVQLIELSHSGYDDQPVRVEFTLSSGVKAYMVCTPNEAEGFFKDYFTTLYTRDEELGSSNANVFNPLPPGGGIQKP